MDRAGLRAVTVTDIRTRLHAPGRVRMLIALSTVGVSVVVIGVVVALSTASSDPTHSASISVDIRTLPIGGVQPLSVNLPGANAGNGRIFVVRESADTVVAFLGRSTASTACRLTWVHDPDRALITDLPAAEFEDPCGGAYYTFAGECIAGPCRRGLDHYAIRVVAGTVRIDLSDLVAGTPRS
jgi:hypothetical protein